MNDRIISFSPGRQLLAPADLKLPVLSAPQKIFEETRDLLAAFSKGGEQFEGVVYWAGKEENGRLEVTEAIAPRASATPVSFRVSAEENARIMAGLVKRDLQIIAQVQSRPGENIQYSLIDEEVGFLPNEGMFLIIVGNYSREGLLPLDEKTAVYCFHEGAFLKLSREQVKSLVVS